MPMLAMIVGALLGRRGLAGGPSLAVTAPLDRFRDRHRSRDPLPAWHRASETDRPSCALVLVALDPTLLDRMDSVTAHPVARSARDHAAVLLEIDPDVGRLPTAAAAAFVRIAAAEWLAKTRLFKPRIDLTVGRSPMIAGDVFQSAWAAARRTFPQYEEGTAGICFLAVQELALDGLNRLDSPEILLVGAARFAAWSISGRLRKASPAAEKEAAATLCIVQAWAVERAEPVLHVPYLGRSGTPGQQALSLARDAAACATLAATRSDLVPRRGAELWQQAAERHAYAGVAMDHAALRELEADQAMELGGHALRYATALVAEDERVMPIFPPDREAAGPASVAGSLRWLSRQAVHASPSCGMAAC